MVEFSTYLEKYKAEENHIPRLWLQAGGKGKKTIDKVNETHCDDLQASMSQRSAMLD